MFRVVLLMKPVRIIVLQFRLIPVLMLALVLSRVVPFSSALYSLAALLFLMKQHMLIFRVRRLMKL